MQTSHSSATSSSQLQNSPIMRPLDGMDAMTVERQFLDVEARPCVYMHTTIIPGHKYIVSIAAYTIPIKRYIGQWNTVFMLTYNTKVYKAYNDKLNIIKWSATYEDNQGYLNQPQRISWYCSTSGWTFLDIT